jgi:hypothetical protein
MATELTERAEADARVFPLRRLWSLWLSSPWQGDFYYRDKLDEEDKCTSDRVSFGFHFN